MIGLAIEPTDGHIAGAWRRPTMFGIAIAYTRADFIELRHTRPRGRWYVMSRGGKKLIAAGSGFGVI